ncbi:hypothetical protein [Streptomyces sp. NPDC001401]|uniref:hypothetical protein n=1 Tax=Streptomyces sp. NPDC001401 TaxID=3364570 RepID=UPI0036984F9E
MHRIRDPNPYRITPLTPKSVNDLLIEVYRLLSFEMWRVLTWVLISAECVDVLLAAGVSWDSVIDGRDALEGTRPTRHAAA